MPRVRLTVMRCYFTNLSASLLDEKCQVYAVCFGPQVTSLALALKVNNVRIYMASVIIMLVSLIISQLSLQVYAIADAKVSYDKFEQTNVLNIGPTTTFQSINTVPMIQEVTSTFAEAKV